MKKRNSRNQSSRTAAITSESGLPTGQGFETFAHQVPKTAAEPSEANISDRAYLLYEKADCCDGHDTEHWFEAIAQLKDKALGSWATAR